VSRHVSVVINTFNRSASLRRTLRSLELLDHPSFEVVVVNGPSTDDTEAVLAEHAGRIKVVRTAARNLSMSRNLGIAAAGGEIVAFIDDDAYPDPAWLDHLDAAYDDPEVAAAGGPTLNHTGAAWQARYSLANRRGNAWISDGPNPTAACSSPYTDVFPYTIGTNSSFRRSTIIDLGGFDEEYEFYLDETDVCLRLIDAGWVVAALDDGVVYHKFLPSDIRTERRAVKHRYSVVKNRVYFALRHARRDHTIAELLADARMFLDHHRLDLRWNIEHGLLDDEDARRFERDAQRATDMAVARGLSGDPRLRPRAWFAERAQPFLPFSTLRPSDGKLHLVFLSREYPPGPLNGIGRFVHVLARGLGRRGHIVHVVTASPSHARVDLEDDVWVHRIAVTPHPQPAGVDLPARIWDYAATAADEVRRIDSRRSVDVVQFPAWDVEGVAVAREETYTTVLSLHTPLLKVVELDETFPAEHPDIARIVAAERELYPLVAGHLANGTSVVKEVERLYGVRLDGATSVPHGMPAAAQVDPLRTEGHHDVLFVGRLEHRKGIDSLLEAIPLVLSRHPDTTFTIAGDDTIPAPGGGTYRERFEQSADAALAGDRVVFRGRLDDDELDRLYAGCELLVAPSRYESFGLILLEAMRHAKPVVAADTGGMRGIVDGNGVLVPPGDAVALAEAISALLADPARRAELGARSLALFEERYSDESMVDGAEALYRRLVSAEPTPPPPTDHRRLGIDLSPLLRCPDCAGPVSTVASVVTADGLVKRGDVVCPACTRTVGAIEQFTYDFHARRPPPTGEAPPRVVPALGERRIDAAALAAAAPGGWARHDRFVLGTGLDAPLRVEVRCTDLAVRLLSHRFSGIVELVVDGKLVATVDLFLAEGALVNAYPVIVDAPYRRHTLEIRPTGRAHPSSSGSQVMVEELVAFGPLRTGLGFRLPEPINRGNPSSAHVLRHLDRVPAGAWVLECGGGDRRGERPRHVNFEYLGFELADALGDIHHLPFADNAFDFVFSQAVFEHVRNPFAAAAELVRVTRPGGLIVTEVAFLQPLHAVPYHYFNMTQWGAEELFRGCEIVESDWFGDLSLSVDWFLRSANLDAKAPAATLASVRRQLQELDRYIDHDDLKAVAAGVYVVARKPA
jgi:glycosyltransferase involved in cell wall biosynthesis/GT2 family glycosyltransferase/SAM-dependent methyltransferase